MRLFILVAFMAVFSFSGFSQKRFYLDELENLEKIESGWSTTKRKTSMTDRPITLNGKVYERGIGLHAHSIFAIALDGKVSRFKCQVGLDDFVAKLGGHSIRIKIFNEGQLLWDSDTIKPGSQAKEVNINTRNSKILRFEVDGLPETWHTHVDFADAFFEYEGEKPHLYERPVEKAEILTPKPGPKPRLTGPKVFGVRPGSPVIFRFSAVGQKPIQFQAKNLPPGLALNEQTGMLSGKIDKEGDYSIEISATNSLGKDSRIWKLKVGSMLALTPPMGWNSWNCWGMSVDAEKVKKSARGMVSSGLIDHGWTFINIDDGWQGPKRDENTGEIKSDPVKFPDMKSLAQEIHNMGLKIGLYSSPGSHTCGKRLGSLLHEALDAKTYADWGYDYLKYDYCSYSKAYDQRYSNDYDVFRPYVVMRDELKKQNRDILYSLCQYGMHQVWKNGDRLNGNLWRTTGDIIDTWNSMKKIGFSQAEYAPFTKPGRWADPDMLVVGKVGWGPNLHPTRLTPNEQYTHISLWCMLSAPLLLGCDLENLDDFTLNLLTNDEVLDINHDPLGIQATPANKDENAPIYLKKLENGDYALAIFNLSENDLQASMVWKNLGLEGKYEVRDVWRQKDLKTNGIDWKGNIPIHGVMMFRLKRKS
jgi:alpha-galactosidase